MIVTEFFKVREDGVKLYRTYSDKGVKIRQVETHIEYDEAIDVENTEYTYEETAVPIEEILDANQKARAYDIITGGAE